MNDKILVTRSSIPPIEDYINEIREIWDSHWLTNMGAKHQLFQRQLEEYLDVDNVELFTNGHMALELSLQALGLSDGEIITTPFTFASTTHAIVRNNLTPVFCDIDPVSFTIDVNKIESLITEKTVAIMPVHVYGIICNYKEIKKIAEKYDLKIIYDAAHAFGETVDGIAVGNLGDVSCFSFHATKVFNSIEGGAACFKDKDLGVRLYQLKNFGIKNEEEVDGVGANAKMNEFCAAMGICNLRRIDECINKRGQLAAEYRKLLNDVKGIQLAPIQNNVRGNYSYFPVVINQEFFGTDRNTVLKVLAKNNIIARKYFYPLTNTFDCFRNQFDVKATPVAKRISERVLTLPLYEELDIDVVKRICEIIKDCRIN